ncbi:MAG: MFS transporter [Candidatus Hodarchaeota archaeon]
MEARLKDNFKFRLYPIWISEITRTASSSLIGIAITTYLEYEGIVTESVNGLITAIYSMGFLIFVAAFRNIIGNVERKKVLSLVSIVIFACSFGYFLPLTNVPSLILFCCFRFMDGAATGIFWATIQSYAKYFAEICPEMRNSYTSKYNFSFTFGIIVGQVVGWILAFFFDSLLVLVQFNLVFVFVQFIFMVFILEKLPDMNNLGRNADCINTEKEPSVRALNSQEKRTITLLPVILVFLALLTHSLSDGAFKIFLPVKSNFLGYPKYVTYIIFFEKYLMQSITITAGAKVPEKAIIPTLVIMPAVIGAGWLIIGFNAGFLAISLGIMLLGTVQGLLYSSGMRFLTNISHSRNNPKIFTWYQMVMGGGRMTGTLFLGFLLEIGLEASFFTVFSFDMLIFGTLLVTWIKRKKTRIKIEEKEDRSMNNIPI